MNLAIVFPGQGSQYIGMGESFYQRQPAAKAVFDEVDAVLGIKLSELIFSGDEQTLAETINTQPAMMAVSIAVFRTWLELKGTNLANLAKFALGHSLGEYSALVATGSLTLEDAAKLLRLRGSAMQQASPNGVGAMAAVLGVDGQTLADWANQCRAPQETLVLANDNCPGQIVVSGHKKSVEQLIEYARGQHKRAIMLKVSAAFHSPMMKKAAEQMMEALAAVNIAKPAVPIISNYRATATTDPEEIRHNLVAQICGRVCWRESVEYMIQHGVTHQLEFGAGKVLTNLGRKINKNLDFAHIEYAEDLTSISSEAGA